MEFLFLFFISFVDGMWIDDDKGALPRLHAARKDVPVERQDTLRVRVRARLAARGRQADQIRLVCVPISIYLSTHPMFVFILFWELTRVPLRSNS